MINFLRSNIEEVQARMKKPAIVSGVIVAIVIGIIIYQGKNIIQAVLMAACSAGCFHYQLEL